MTAYLLDDVANGCDHDVRGFVRDHVTRVVSYPDLPG
jgi:hypothetical protein